MIRFIIAMGFGIFVGYSIGTGRLDCHVGRSTAGCSLPQGIGAFGLPVSIDGQSPARWNEPQSFGSQRATSDPVPLHAR